jgi:hypothetical protein
VADVLTLLIMCVSLFMCGYLLGKEQ